MEGAFGYTFEVYILYILGYFLAGINASINVVIYGIFMPQYRAMFLKHFCNCNEIQKISYTNVIFSLPLNSGKPPKIQSNPLKRLFLLPFPQVC